MHREIRDHIEDVLNGAQPGHLAQCAECSIEIRGMQEQTALIRELRAPAGFAEEPRPGFYARVMERIEAEGPISIWNLFIESAFGRRIAVASLALALLVCVYLVASERSEDFAIVAGSQPAVAGQMIVAGEDAPARIISRVDQSSEGQPAQDAVLADLVTYRDR